MPSHNDARWPAILEAGAVLEHGTPSFGGTGLTLAELEALAPAEADARLALAIVAHRATLDRLRQELAEAESLLAERMMARGATAADCGNYEASLTFARRYDYDTEMLATLQRWLDVDTYERAVRWEQPAPVLKVDKRELNQLEKLGGDVAATIQAAVRDVTGPPKLMVRPKGVKR